jgi:hypothetical protein
MTANLWQWRPSRDRFIVSFSRLSNEGSQLSAQFIANIIEMGEAMNGIPPCATSVRFM